MLTANRKMDEAKYQQVMCCRIISTYIMEAIFSININEVIRSVVQ